MESKEIATPETFEQRVGNKIRESIGDLMTDEDVKKLVEKGMRDAFFTEKRTSNGYNRQDTVTPPLIHRIVVESMTERIDAAVKTWLTENRSEVNEILDKHLSEQTGELILQAITRQFEQPLNQLKWNLQTAMNINLD